MLGLKSTMNIIDNSGALVAEVINVLKVKSGSGIGSVGDECVVVIQSAKPIPANLNISANSPAAANKIRKGDIRRAVIVRTKQQIRRPDGRFVRFDDNAGVLINPKKELLGSRISGVIANEVRQKGWGKIASVAPKLL
ncbi:hypothetical protein J056_000883 [Wallemia ichthyophaga EXF-994]|uniref:Large ribosomal subunit protein uL14m n=1 Tax=Wallemia ichthyophaga (strain EXF-994 / CBS 113033) TaxID=1299270 RepID=R9ADZ2_WALI9|nr:uncharacterized protein J056_000883 [Wallemia ichthyophaga EXF-994]EOR00345.1 hypothetical protein J056_000883 [Wallemia ichthyophaga EXF-994]